MEAHAAYSPIPALAALVPILAALLVYPLGTRSEKARDWFAVTVAAVTFLGAVWLIPLVSHSHVVACDVSVLMATLTFRVDSFGMLFGLFTAFVWMLSTLYAGDYMHHEQHRSRYHTYNLALLGANMGVVFAGDLLTLYVFFEALGLLAYWIVVHTESDDAKAASTKYLWMTVIGGFMLLAGIFLVLGTGSGGLMEPMRVREGLEAMRWGAAVLMVLGFGVKAGMLPVHVWLPDAHPVAPSPGSALLSGVMIKAGAYGIFRVVGTLFRPPVVEHLTEEAWHFTSQLGLLVLGIGIATALIGVIMALLQENAKRMLAYHSVSQMGFILTGIGAAGYLGPHAAMGVAGGLYHVLNHALFKACLFLGVGAVFFRTGELNMYKLGGLWRRMPLTFLFTLVAALGITGVPLFNGFVSKCLIHHALVEAYELHELVALKAAEIIYIITCGGTAASFIKLIGFVFLRPATRDYGEIGDAPPRMLFAMGALAVAITAFGLAPQLVLQGVMTPGLHTWGLHSEILKEFTLLTGENLESAIYAFTIGGVIFVVGVKFGLFHAHFPSWLSIDWWYEQGVRGLLALFRGVAVAYEVWLRMASRVLAVARACVASLATGRTHERIAWWFSMDRWYQSAGVVLLALFAATGRGYEWCLRQGSVSLRVFRTRYVRAATHTRRRWKRLWLTMTTGAPMLRRRRCVDQAYVVLDEERQATVRDAVMAALRKTRAVVTGPERQPYVDAVRQVADYMATRLFKERLAVVGDAVQHHPGERVDAAVRQSLPGLSRYRAPVVEAALALAGPRQEGRSIVIALAHAMNELLRQERYDVQLHGLLAAQMVPGPAALAAARGRGVARRLVPRLEAARAYSAEQLTAIERSGKWLMDTLRIIVEVSTEERVPWMIEERIRRDSIVATRMAIQRYARDISLSVAVVALLFLGILAAVLAGMR